MSMLTVVVVSFFICGSIAHMQEWRNGRRIRLKIVRGNPLRVQVSLPAQTEINPLGFIFDSLYILENFGIVAFI